MMKSHEWLANFVLSLLELRCRKPAALAGSSHGHVHVRGWMMHEGKCCSVATYRGAYSPELATVYAPVGGSCHWRELARRYRWRYTLAAHWRHTGGTAHWRVPCSCDRGAMPRCLCPWAVPRPRLCWALTWH